MLFTIPVGGGIPAGVILADGYGITPATMAVLYFFSDIALAIVFEPIMRGFALLSRHSQLLTRFSESLKNPPPEQCRTTARNPDRFF